MSIDVVYAIDSAAVALPGGGQVRIQKGEHWVSSDPVVTQYPHLFSGDARYGARYTARPAGFDDAAPVESATAAPGEQRATRRRS